GADLRAQSLAFLQEHFGKAGGWYYRISRGIDERPVQPHRQRKSIGSEDTFAEDVFDPERARAETATLAARVWGHLVDRALRARTVTRTVKYADFRQITRSRTLSVPLASADELQGLAFALLDPLFPTDRGIRLIGVTLSTLDDPEPTQDTARQLSLW
ncbi:MAG: DNA polymerase IV, partial [Pararhodobacter sp.]|nr:DNA polymerase IV [Pararhodobacter sp.]